MDPAQLQRVDSVDDVDEDLWPVAGDKSVGHPLGEE